MRIRTKIEHYFIAGMAVVIVLLLSGCSANNLIRRAQKKGALISHDTIYKEIRIPSSTSDTVTVVRPINFHDTITIQTTKWRTRTLITRDTVHNRDTIWQEVTCPEKRIIVPVEVNTKVDCPKCKKWGWWNWMMIGVIGALALIVLIRR